MTNLHPAFFKEKLLHSILSLIPRRRHASWAINGIYGIPTTERGNKPTITSCWVVEWSTVNIPPSMTLDPRPFGKPLCSSWARVSSALLRWKCTSNTASGRREEGNVRVMQQVEVGRKLCVPELRFGSFRHGRANLSDESPCCLSLPHICYLFSMVRWEYKLTGRCLGHAFLT